MDHNFASIEIEKLLVEGQKPDLKVHFSIRDKNGLVVIQRTFQVSKDLTYNEKKVRYGTMCHQSHSRAAKILMFN